MSGARYLVRFDDICPTMDWAVWDRLQPVLDRHGVRPLLAVVPDNQDPKLVAGPAAADFWARVRGWQARGWTIALHGYQHRYESHDGGLLGINAYSEFAGLPEAVQRDKLQRALAIFERERVRADAWIAPAHSFDAVTVRLLLASGVRVISDGFYGRPVRHLGALWVPQQLWRFRSMPFGLWTVCYHHNHLDAAGIARFEADIAAYADRIVDLATVLAPQRAPARGWIDRAFAAAWRTALNARRRSAA